MHVIVCASVCEFKGQNSLRGGGGGGWLGIVKLRKNSIFLKKGKTVIYHYNTGGKFEIFLYLE